MAELDLLIVLIAVSVVLVRLADLVQIPYPIVLVIAGIGIGFAPIPTEIELRPEVIFLVFLPPLLYAAGLTTSAEELKTEAGALGGLVVGLTLATMAAVAAVSVALIPGFTWLEGFLLGAIVCPTDPVAAVATFARVGVPKRVAVLVEGESLINDAVALVLYKVALAAVLTGALTGGEVVSDLVLAVAGGLAVGLAIAWTASLMQRRLDDPPLAILLSVVVAYGSYLVAEQIGASGVLAVVAAGVFSGWRSPVTQDAETRLTARSFWGALVFALNVILFILLGLRLPSILDAVSGHLSVWEMVGYGALVSLVVIVVRLAWQFGPVSAGRFFSPALRFDTGDGWKERLIVGWSGMRGAVSLAAALSLPIDIDSGLDAGREIIVFLAVAVILSTLVFQGLTLPVLIKAIGLGEKEEWSPEDSEPRVALARAATEKLEEIESDPPDHLPPGALERIRNLYEIREERWTRSAAGPDHHDRADRPFDAVAEVRLMLIDSERKALDELRSAGKISADSFAGIQRELDLDEARVLNS